jgi:ParB-like nuclease domain
VNINPALVQLAVPIDQLYEDPANVRLHPERNLQAIESSLRQFGQQKPVVAMADGKIIAGNGTWRAAKNIGAATVAAVTFDDENEARAMAYALADNRTAELAAWDFGSLTAQLDMLGEAGFDLPALGFTPEDIASFTGATQDTGRGKIPKRRAIPLDLIFCSSSLVNIWMSIAYDAGWKAGCQSTTTGRLERPERWRWRYDISFVDCDFKKYDHATHLMFVEHVRPKYATVRDLMTQRQCRDAGIAYHDFDTVMGWAAQLREVAQNVIVIPKYDCVADIPPEYVLGYSVVSSYGATPLPAEVFAGRRVHLLGGAWADQLGLLSILGDDVVSLDKTT